MTKGWKIAGIAVAVGVLTYVGLELLLPHRKIEVKLEGLVPADTVFGDKLKSPEEVAAAAATPGSAGADAGATTPSGPAVTTDDATAAAPSTAEAPPAETAPAPAAPETEPAVAPEPAPTPEPAKPAPRPQPKKPAVAAKPAPPGPWWQAGAGKSGLQVIYAGSAAFKRAIVVMGNAPFADAGAGRSIRVSDAAGKAVAGQWELGPNNKAMLVFPVAQAGRYQVTVGSDLTDAQGRKLGRTLKGGVQVQ